jgi:hypothetical protein
MLRDGTANTIKADVQTSDSILPKRLVQPVESALPIVPETAHTSTS